MSETCNKCESRNAVADWGVCRKCFQSDVDSWIEEELIDGDDNK